MKVKVTAMLLLVCAGSGLAQDRMADTLRNGIVEEDSKQNSGAAIEHYQVVMAQYSEARQTAATALFRMAECYRKQGNRQRAEESYLRVVNEFGDQEKLAGQSRTVLATAYRVVATKAKPEKLMDGQTRYLAKVTEARARYRSTIEEEMALTAKQLVSARKRNPTESAAAAVAELEGKLIHLQRDLAAFDAGMTSPVLR